MKIVLTNDDGIEASGLKALFRATEGLGDRYVIAPLNPQSGVGHKVTTRDPIAVRELDERRVAVDGTPVDCSRVALKHLVEKADWLLAGINHGGNLGADLYPSGTVAAAREAALLGCRSIALSQYILRDREVDWEATARRAARVIRRLLEEPWPEGSFWSVNLPHPDGDADDQEIVFCPIDPSPMDVRFRRDGTGFIYEGSYHERPRVRGHDVDTCFSGKIAVSRVSLGN